MGFDILNISASESQSQIRMRLSEIRKVEKRTMKRLFPITATVIVLTLFNSPLHAQPVCKTESFPQLPDVNITAVTQESAPAPHCKVVGVIGLEIGFELLLPEKWNGKFVMGGSGGFAGSFVN